MTPNTLRRIGTAINGGRKYGWQQKVAKIAAVTDRTVRRWYAGEAPVPAVTQEKLRDLEKSHKRSKWK